MLIHFELKTTHTFTTLLIRNIISVSEQPQLRQHMLLWNVNCSKNTFTSNKCLAPYTSLHDYMTLHDWLEPMLAKHKICCCLGHETVTDWVEKDFVVALQLCHTDQVLLYLLSKEEALLPPSQSRSVFGRWRKSMLTQSVPGLVPNPILLCWLFTIKDQCKKVRIIKVCVSCFWQGYKDIVRCAALGTDVPGHPQKHTQTLIVSVVKKHFPAQILDCEKST